MLTQVVEGRLFELTVIPGGVAATAGATTGGSVMHHWATDGDLANTEGRLAQLINNRFDQLKELILTGQQSVDALTAEVTNAVTTITTDFETLATDATAVQTEITALQAQIAAGGTVDLTALQAAASSLDGSVTSLGTSVSSVSALVPTPPTT